MLEIAAQANPLRATATTNRGEGNFRISLDPAGNTCYQWHDTAIEDLSSMKLWDILRQAQPGRSELQRRFSVAINNELAERGEQPPPDVKCLFTRYGQLN